MIITRRSTVRDHGTLVVVQSHPRMPISVTIDDGEVSIHIDSDRHAYRLAFTKAEWNEVLIQHAKALDRFLDQLIAQGTKK